MNTKLVNSAAGVINAALTQNRTAAGIALALESAQLLLTPETAAELGRLAKQVVALGDQLVQAQKATVRAQRERDLVRERVSEPFGCKHCGEAKRSHGRQWMVTVGMHGWERPSDEQVKDRMLARRAARFTSHADQLAKLLVARTEDLLAAEGRIAELETERHSTNEALDDAVQALRKREAQDSIVAKFVAARAEYVTSIRNCHPDNGHDYDRWQGHAAARRQLSELLGLPVAWPVEDAASVAKSADKLTRLLAPTLALREDEPLIVDADGAKPTPLRWGINDVQWGDDDSVIVMLSGPQGEPYWLELEADRAAVLRQDLGGPDGAEAGEPSC